VEAAQTAQEKAEDAQRAAETAQTEAEGAKRDAESASGDAVAAKTAAESARGEAELARERAVNAMNAAEAAAERADWLLEQKGQPGGLAELDVNGKVPTSQIPDEYDDYREYAKAMSFPNPGRSGVLYCAMDTGLLYRWDTARNTYYTVGGSGLTLGETFSTAYRGDRGKSAYDVTEAISYAESGDVGKALSPKTVVNGRVTEWQFITGGTDEDVATPSEVKAVIDEYDPERKKVTTYETTFVQDADGDYYETSDYATDIAETFMSGHSVAIFLPYANTSGGTRTVQDYREYSPAYMQMVEYRPSYENSYGYTVAEYFGFSNGTYVERATATEPGQINHFALDDVRSVEIASNGKLRIWVYWAQSTEK
jgi:hypothetical protein